MKYKPAPVTQDEYDHVRKQRMEQLMDRIHNDVGDVLQPYVHESPVTPELIADMTRDVHEFIGTQSLPRPKPVIKVTQNEHDSNKVDVDLTFTADCIIHE